MVTYLRPWTLVVSEYLDLSFVLRKAGESVVPARSASEAIDCLRHWCPSRIVVDTDCFGAEQVIAFAQQYCPQSTVEQHDQVISRMLVS